MNAELDRLTTALNEDRDVRNSPIGQLAACLRALQAEHNAHPTLDGGLVAARAAYRVGTADASDGEKTRRAVIAQVFQQDPAAELFANLFLDRVMR